MRVIFLLFCVWLSACSSGSSKMERRIGVDASWFPLGIAGRENNVTGFSTELLKEIGKVEKISITKVTVNWDNLIEGLQQHKYEAILSSIPPYTFNQQVYDFSELYLATGPVLVVPIKSAFESLGKLTGKEIGVVPDSKGAIVLEKYPAILIRSYDSVPQALNAIVHGALDGALVDALSAAAYCQDLYQNQLKIVTPPLTAEGLRLLTMHGQASDLLLYFNRGLDKLKASKTYDKLLAKWNLGISNAKI
jgi:polar amino acid transport system substrate-binding protein